MLDNSGTMGCYGLKILAARCLRLNERKIMGEDCLRVLIARSPGSYPESSVELDIIKNIHWDCLSGGCQKRQAGDVIVWLYPIYNRGRIS